MGQIKGGNRIVRCLVYSNVCDILSDYFNRPACLLYCVNAFT